MIRKKGKKHRWIESICVENGNMPLLEYHQRRMERTIYDHFQQEDFPRLADIEQPNFVGQGWYKCRVTYDRNIQSVQWIPYEQGVIRRLIIKEVPGLSYGYKWADRSALHSLKEDLEEVEEVLIVQNGFIKDTTYSNVLCYDGSTYWTPAPPLLEGTRRQYLIDQGIAKEKTIEVRDLHQFKSIVLINAMVGIDKGPTLNIDQIKGGSLIK